MPNDCQEIAADHKCGFSCSQIVSKGRKTFNFLNHKISFFNHVKLDPNKAEHERPEAPRRPAVQVQAPAPGPGAAGSPGLRAEPERRDGTAGSAALRPGCERGARAGTGLLTARPSGAPGRPARPEPGAPSAAPVPPRPSRPVRGPHPPAAPAPRWPSHPVRGPRPPSGPHTLSAARSQRTPPARPSRGESMTRTRAPARARRVAPAPSPLRKVKRSRLQSPSQQHRQRSPADRRRGRERSSSVFTPAPTAPATDFRSSPTNPQPSLHSPRPLGQVSQSHLKEPALSPPHCCPPITAGASTALPALLSERRAPPLGG